MPEYLITYRNVITNALHTVHICNVDTEEHAIELASNSHLEDECTFEQLFKLSPEESSYLDCPF